MGARGRLGLGLLVSGLALGLLGDALFNGRALGVNAAVWAVLFVAALAVLMRLGRVPLHQGRRWMAAPFVLFAGLLVWHDSPLLVAVNLCAVAGAVAIGAVRRTERRVAHAGVDDYVAGVVNAGAATILGGVELMQREVPWQEVARGVRSPQVAAVVRGIGLGLPLLILFGGLFAAADAVFENLLSSAAPGISYAWLGHVLLAAAIAWVSAGLLRDLLASREDERVLSVRASAPRIGTTELAVALAAVDALFLVFVLVQLRYFFGGESLVEARLGLTYAQYARHGFFELVAVAALVLPVLLGVNALARGTVRQVRIVRALSACLIVLVGVVMVSALQRLWLYQEQYGLTELRIYVTGVVLWLGIVFAWLAVTVLRGRSHLFAVGAVVSGFAATLCLNVVDPDALIARTNLSRPKVDVQYLGRLSDDAVPTLLAQLPSLEPAQRRDLARALLARDAAHDGWLSWNASRSRASSLLERHRDELRTLAR